MYLTVPLSFPAACCAVSPAPAVQATPASPAPAASAAHKALGPPLQS